MASGMSRANWIPNRFQSFSTVTLQRFPILCQRHRDSRISWRSVCALLDIECRVEDAVALDLALS